jgi:hypothetical protein
LYWAWVGDEPFRRVLAKESNSHIEIFGFAICFLGGTIYRFSCDQNWKVQFDTDFPSIQEAMTTTTMQDPDKQIPWQKYDDTDVEKLIADSRLVRYYQETGERRVIQQITDHMKTRGCVGMTVQRDGKDNWVLSVWKKDEEIAREIAQKNIQ